MLKYFSENLMISFLKQGSNFHTLFHSSGFTCALWNSSLLHKPIDQSYFCKPRAILEKFVSCLWACRCIYSTLCILQFPTEYLPFSRSIITATGILVLNIWSDLILLLKTTLMTKLVTQNILPLPARKSIFNVGMSQSTTWKVLTMSLKQYEHKTCLPRLYFATISTWTWTEKYNVDAQHRTFDKNTDSEHPADARSPRNEWQEWPIGIAQAIKATGKNTHLIHI